MQIDTLTIQDLKGLNVAETLGAETLIVGKNFTGKTARMQAIQLALLGYIPGIGKTNPDIFALASGPVLSVTAQTKDAAYTRTLRSSGKSVSRDDNAPAAADPLLAMLDASKFLAASGPEKLAMIFALAQVKTEDTRESLTGKMPFGVEFPAFQGVVTTTDWIAAALPHAQEQLKYAKQSIERMGQTQAGMVALEPEVVPNLPHDLDAQIAAQEGKLQPLRKTLMEMEVASDNYARDLRNYESSLASYRTYQAGIADKREALKNRPAIEKAIKELTAKLPGFDPNLDRTRQAINEVERLIAMNQRTLRDKQTAIADCTKERDDLKELECCPFCKSKGKGWRKTLEETIDGRVEKLDKEIGEINAQITTFQAELETAKTAHQAEEATMKERTEAREALHSKERDLARLVEIETDLNRPGIAEPKAPTAPEDNANEQANISQEIEEAEETLATLRGLTQQAEQAKARNATAAQAQIKAEKTVGEKEAWAKAVAILDESRTKIVEDAFKSLLEAAQHVYAGILDSPLIFRDGKLGKLRGSKFVPFSAFSGTEALVATLSLQVALGANSPARIALVDEMGRLDVENKNKLVTNLHHMVAGKILDQWIGIDVQKPSKKVAGITVIEA